MLTRSRLGLHGLIFTVNNRAFDKAMLSRIGIIGDVHAEHQHLETALKHLIDQQVDVIVCTGDLVDGKGDVDACIELLKAFNVHTVRGNHDRWVLEDKARHVPNAHLRIHLQDNSLEFLATLPQQIDLHTTSGRLMLCHGVGNNDLQKVWPGTARMPAERSLRLDNIIAQGQYNFMVNGHVHYRTLIHFEALTLLNAGTLRGDHHPGFSLLDLDDNVVHGFELEPAVHEVKTLALNPHSSARVFKDTQHFDDAWEPVTLYA
jgi:predicted phosphodiesterase